MSLFKKISLLLLFVPLFFAVFSFVAGQKAHAAATKDLDITAFNFPGGVDTGTSNSTLTIKNIGNTKITGNFNVKVENKANHSGASQVWAVTQTVSAGESISHTFTNMPRPSAGSYTALATVDSGGNIAESNEHNNTKTDSYATTGTSITCTGNHKGWSLDVTPATNQGNKGTTQNYTVTITNNDDISACPASDDFTLTKTITNNTNGWTGSFADNTLSNIARGGHKSTTLHITSPSGATAGSTKTIVVNGVGHDHTGAKTKSVTYVVTGSTTTPTPTDGGPTPTPTYRPTPVPTTCIRIQPTLAVTADKTFVKPGGKITYTIKVKNVDEGPCPERNMNLTRTLHNDNWKGVWDPNNSFKFKKGEIRNKKLAVTSPNQAPIRTYKVKVNLRNSDNEVVLSKEVGFVVSNTPVSPTPPPPTPTDGGPSPTPTPPPGSTLLNFKIGVDGIGDTPRIPSKIIEYTVKEGDTIATIAQKSGASVNSIKLLNGLTNDELTVGQVLKISLGGNLNPQSKSRNLTVKMFSASDNSLKHTIDWNFTYGSTSRRFETVISDTATDTISTGLYNVYVEGSRFLRVQYPGTVNITRNQANNLNSDNFYLITGNVNDTDTSENKLDFFDYNILLSCSIYSQSTTACDENPNYKTYSDLNDDGLVNEDDFTLFLKELLNQQGAILP